MIMAGLKSIRVLLFKQKQDRYCFLHSLLTINNLNVNVKMFSKVSKPEIFLWNSTSYRIKTCYPNGAWFFFQFPSWTKRETKKLLNSKDRWNNISKFQKKCTFSCRVRNKRRATLINVWNFSGQNQEVSVYNLYAFMKQA